MIDFIGKRNYFFTLSIILTVIGLIALLVFGVEADIDFKGGAIIELNIGKQFDNNKITEIVKNVTGQKAPIVQAMGANKDQVSIKTEDLSQEQIDGVIAAVKKEYGLGDNPLLRISKVQPLIGDELKQRGITAVIIASLGILLYVAARFRMMSGFSAGTTAVIALIHDLLIMISVYSLFRVPVNSAFIAAVLTILGYSINDTIIVYDRIRENQGLLKKVPIAELVNKSINQTMARSINTVVTVIISILCLYIAGIYFGVQSIREFTFPLLIGIISGAYSSIFIASPLWVMWRESASKKKVSAKPAKA